ncbi:MAG: hypothetical protein CK431_04485 [Mycobacterium sp.]|nr:MAG: hypothetical protein CK431_04485 [Mycobacterium sp.]
MSDVRDRLAAALYEHRHLRDDDCAVTCACGAGLFTVRAHARHVADALLSLDQVAIVQLPEQMSDRETVTESIREFPMWQVGDAWACAIATGEIEIEADGQDLCGHLINGAAAHDLAAALLAAACNEGEK